MYKAANKVISTPNKRDIVNSSCSASDIKCTSSDSLNQKYETSIKEHTFDNYNKKKTNIKRKRKFSKIKSDNKRIRFCNKRGRKFILSETSESESELELIKRNWGNVHVSKILSTKSTNEINQFEESKIKLFESPESVRDIKCYNDHDNLLLSPPFISEISNLEQIIANKENYEGNITLDESIKEIDISPIIRKTNRIKTYPSAKLKRLKRIYLKNTISDDWSPDYKVSTHYADLLWHEYMKEHCNEFPEHFQASKINIEKMEETYKDETSDSEDSLEMLNLLDENYLKLFKSKPVCRLRGTLSKNPESLPTTSIERIIYVPDETSCSKSNEKKYKRGKWLKEKKSFEYKSSDSNNDLHEKSVNEFHRNEKKRKFGCKRSQQSRRNNQNHECYSVPSSSTSLINNFNAKIISMKNLKSKKYKKKKDDNYYLSTEESSS